MLGFTFFLLQDIFGWSKEEAVGFLNLSEILPTLSGCNGSGAKHGQCCQVVGFHRNGQQVRCFAAVSQPRATSRIMLHAHDMSFACDDAHANALFLCSVPPSFPGGPPPPVRMHSAANPCPTC